MVTNQIWGSLMDSADFVCEGLKAESAQYNVGYFKSIIDSKTLHQILKFITEFPKSTVNELFEELPFPGKEMSSQLGDVQNKLLRGYIAIQQDGEYLLIEASISKGRNVTVPEVEFTVEGPKEAFVESLDTNIYLIRKRIPHTDLRVKEIIIGSESKSTVAVLYKEGQTNEQYLNTCIQRIKDVQFDQIPDITLLQQMIEDNSNSIFPQSIGSERPDYAVWAITTGQVCILLDGSPTAVFAPVSLGQFFTSYEDYLLPWVIGTVLRIIRMFSVFFSIFATPLYVAVMTYHGQGISNIFLPTIISSRLNVPFPPVVEVLIMEIVIELLREAGARLPTKIGQTIGIVGGIVLGTAAVEAAVTSNFLLIIVALAALASFTTPVFRMSVTIRILRFPFIIAAQLWGLLGIVTFAVIVFTHLLRLTSLGMPYLVPFYPFRSPDLFDSVIRSPYSKYHHKFTFFRSPKPERFNKEDANVKKDIDE